MPGWSDAEGSQRAEQAVTRRYNEPLVCRNRQCRRAGDWHLLWQLPAVSRAIGRTWETSSLSVRKSLMS